MSHTQYEPTPEVRAIVERLSGFGFTQDNIAKFVGCNRETLKRHYDDELQMGVLKCNEQIAKTMFEKAIAGDRTLLIWWSKARMGWHETIVNEHGGINGGAIKIALSHADNEL